MLKLTAVTLVVIIGCLIESTEQCTDDFVKQMAVSVCGLSKRSISTDNNWSLLEPLRRIFGLNFGGISDVEREYRQLIGDVDEAEFLLNVSDKKKPKEPNVVRQRPRHFSIYGDKTIGRTIPKPGLNYDDGRYYSSVEKRDIITLVTECCYRKCTVDDFKGICDKK